MNTNWLITLLQRAVRVPLGALVNTHGEYIRTGNGKKVKGRQEGAGPGCIICVSHLWVWVSADVIRLSSQES